MSKLENFNSPEKEILLEVFQKIPMMDKWIAGVIESITEELMNEVKMELLSVSIEQSLERRMESIKGGGITDNYIQTTYVEGERYGEYKKWHINGQLWKLGTFVEGERYGEYKSWLSDGQPSVQTKYVKGKLQVV